jgi:cytochrome c oxidase subunit III
MTTRRAIDVSKLEPHVLDHRSPIWWGNLMLLFIESTMFAILVACYLYYRVVDFHQWPPPRVNIYPTLQQAYPALAIPTANLIVIVLSAIPIIWVDKSCLERKTWAVKIGLIITVLFGAVAIALRFNEFTALKFRWDDNAYGSVTWLILGMHLAHLITATCESVLMAVWIWTKGMDDKHARDIRTTCIYWYWVVGTWILLYTLIFWGPRFL